MAHSVNSSNECRAIEKWQEDNKKARTNARNALQEILNRNNLNIEINDDLILRYLRWQEQGERCVYTGQAISESQMVTDCDIEHTLPRSLGGTSRRENLTLCDRHYNRDIKKGFLPSECPNATTEWLDPSNGKKYPAIDQSAVIKKWNEEVESLSKQLKSKPVRGSDPAAYNQARQKWLVLKMKRDYFSAKLGYFKMKRSTVDRGGFMPRQLADTGAMTRRAIAYLQTRYAHVYPTNGTSTAFARKIWGIQKVNEKDRTDHTHHAVDAMVIAALSREAFQKICSYFENHDSDSVMPVITPPYPNFAEQVHHAKEEILVRHLRSNASQRPTAKTPQGSVVHGPLHNDTLYGRIMLPGTNKVVTVIRKTIAAAENAADLKKWAKAAVDPVVGQQLLAQMDAYRKQGIADKDLKAQRYWVNKDEGIELKKLRIQVTKPANPTPIRAQVFQGVHEHKNSVYISSIPSLAMCGWKNEKGKWQVETINLLDIAKKKKCEEWDQNKPGAFVLYPGQLVLAYENSPDELQKMTRNQLAKRMYRVVQTFGERQAIFRFHREARSTTMLSQELPMMKDSETNLPLKANGESRINYRSPNPQLLLSISTFAEHLLFEGRDFQMGIDGQIKWRD